MSPLLDSFDYFVDDLQPVFVDDFLNDQRRREINNFKNFMDYYLQYVDINLSVPHTLCGFILSPRMSHRNSGLVINLSNDNPGKDSEKWTKYLSNDFFGITLGSIEISLLFFGVLLIR